MRNENDAIDTVHLISMMVRRQFYVEEKLWELKRREGSWWADTSRRPFLALITEIGELLDHDGRWPWWKAGSANEGQLRIELVDIWAHFAPLLLTPGVHINAFYGRLIETLPSGTVEPRSPDSYDPEELEHLVMGLVSTLVQLHTTPRAEYDLAPLAVKLVHLGHLMGVSVEEVYTFHLAKSALNVFRAENGYLEGTYRKHWYGDKEDNEALIDFIHEAVANETIPTWEHVTDFLAEKYREITGSETMIVK